jgi:hypothetical protein
MIKFRNIAINDFSVSTHIKNLINNCRFLEPGSNPGELFNYLII